MVGLTNGSVFVYSVPHPQHKKSYVRLSHSSPTAWISGFCKISHTSQLPGALSVLHFLIKFALLFSSLVFFISGFRCWTCLLNPLLPLLGFSPLASIEKGKGLADFLILGICNRQALHSCRNCQRGPKQMPSSTTNAFIARHGHLASL